MKICFSFVALLQQIRLPWSNAPNSQQEALFFPRSLIFFNNFPSFSLFFNIFHSFSLFFYYFLLFFILFHSSSFFFTFLHSSSSLSIFLPHKEKCMRIQLACCEQAINPLSDFIVINFSDLHLFTQEISKVRTRKLPLIVYLTCRAIVFTEMHHTVSNTSAYKPRHSLVKVNSISLLCKQFNLI